MSNLKQYFTQAVRRAGIARAAALALIVLSPVAASGDDEKKAAPAATSKAPGGAETTSATGFGLAMDRAKLLMKKLDERQRKVDPFGMSMDPEEEVVHVEEAEEAAPRQVTTLEEAVARFKVSGVVPKRSEVIVGARSLGLGDKILIEHHEVKFELTIVEITSKIISLKDNETGEIASVDLGIVPESLPSAVAGEGAPAPGDGILAMDSAYEVE